MSDIYIVWAEDPNRAQARLEDIVAGSGYRVLRRDNFLLAQAEDLDSGKSITSGGERYCIVFELF